MSEIIAFFSRKGENYINGQIKYLPIGYTELAARALQEVTEADLFKIEPACPYPNDYSECINRAMNDKRQGARPKLAGCPKHLYRYRTVYLGFPNYFGTMPMPVFTFLESYCFSGKEIKLFCTHAGDGFGRSIEDVRCLCPGAEIRIGPAICGAHMADAKREFEQWIFGSSKR